VRLVRVQHHHHPEQPRPPPLLIALSHCAKRLLPGTCLLAT
jgi:hypothetical protein